MCEEKLTIGGLCSGVGGIELGFQNAGFDIAWANDMDPKAMITYQRMIGKNHYIGKEAMKIDEILSSEENKNKLTDVNVVAAGFPCQAFSIAGERKGFEDARGTVIWDIFKIVEELRNNYDSGGPDVIFLENVKNFKTHDNCNTYNDIEAKLYEMGYSVYTKVLNTCDYSNLPQNRERTYMVCFKGEGAWKEYRLHEKNNEPSEKDEDAKKKCPKTFMFHQNFPSKIDSAERLSKNDILDLNKSPGKKYSYWKNSNKDYVTMLNEEYDEMKNTNPGSEDTYFQIRRVYSRGNKNKLCPTLTANMGTGGHNVPLIPKITKDGRRNWRRLTPKECFYMQGYPEFRRPNKKVISDGQLYKQAGNSVTVPLIKIIAVNIKNSLEL